jgi:hypothetical protein
MAVEVRVKMLRDVGGFAAGKYRTLNVADAERLEARGVVEIVGKPVRKGPAKVRAKTAPRKRTQSAPARRTQAAAPLTTKG